MAAEIIDCSCHVIIVLKDNRMHSTANQQTIQMEMHLVYILKKKI